MNITSLHWLYSQFKHPFYIHPENVYSAPTLIHSGNLKGVRCQIGSPRFRVLSKGIDETSSALAIDQVSLTFEAFISGQRLSSKLQKNSADSSSKKRRPFGLALSTRQFIRYK